MNEQQTKRKATARNPIEKLLNSKHFQALQEKIATWMKENEYSNLEYQEHLGKWQVWKQGDFKYYVGDDFFVKFLAAHGLHLEQQVRQTKEGVVYDLWFTDFFEVEQGEEKEDAPVSEGFKATDAAIKAALPNVFVRLNNELTR